MALVPMWDPAGGWLMARRKSKPDQMAMSFDKKVPEKETAPAKAPEASPGALRVFPTSSGLATA